MGGVVGGIVLIWRGVTTPVTTPNHSDPSFYCLPCKEEIRGGLTHDACSPVHVVEPDQVRGPLTYRRHPGKMLLVGSLVIPRYKSTTCAVGSCNVDAGDPPPSSSHNWA